jgi:hypothetical protein
MTSTFTITLRGASVARLLQEMAALLCGSLGMSMAAAFAGLSSLLARLARRFNSALSSQSMLLPQVATRQFQCPDCVVEIRPADAGKYGFIGHINWLKNERTKIRSEECWPSATFS